MKRIRVFIFLFILFPLLPGSPQANSGADGVYLIPQTIYVGDHGRLVLPLGAAYGGMEPLVITEKNLLPSSPDLVISRIEIDRKTGAPRLLVDFQAYAPGLLRLPVLKIGNQEFSALNVRISSILDGEGGGDMVLSDPAPPMAVPGTLVIVYGSIIAVIFLLFIVLYLGIWGIPYFRASRKWRYRKLALRALQRSLHKMKHSIAKNGVPAGKGNDLLADLSREFRKFLRLISGANCLTMVPKEFLSLPALMKSGEERGGELYIMHNPDILYGIFKQCDDLRFSGTSPGKTAVLSVLDEIQRFADAFESFEKDRTGGGDTPRAVQGAVS